MKSFVNWYVVSLLYKQPQGMTSTMIYEVYGKTLFEPKLVGELRESRSCVIAHLNELETEAIIQKGLFKQYVLTDKSRSIREKILKLARNVKAEEKERVTEKAPILPPHVEVAVELPTPLKQSKKEKKVKPKKRT